MLKGTCHCGTASWTLDAFPTSATACNCTICRRYGVLWAYGYIDETIHAAGQTSVYERSDSGDIAFHFCSKCGCVTHYVASDPDENGRRWTAVNLRMAEPDPIFNLPVRHFEGHISFKDLPLDGRKVSDMWF